VAARGPAGEGERVSPHTHGSPREAGARRLALTLGLTALYLLVELAGGLVSGSLALLADAGHMLSDVAALALSLVAMRIAHRPPTPRRTYGYHRAEILAALANGAALVAIAALIVREAVGRLAHPPEVRAGLMMAVAAGGLVINLASLALLHREREAGLNLRGAWLHVLTDALGSLQAIGAGALIVAFGWRWADPLASMLIAVLVAYSAWGLVRESIAVLMEGSPEGVDVTALGQAIGAVEGVTGVHDLHVWTITSGFVSLSAHVQVVAGHEALALAAIRTLLASRFGIEHATIQVEPSPLPQAIVMTPPAREVER
jgi:cobalt-zinc-cadmium efflux system protein